MPPGAEETASNAPTDQCLRLPRCTYQSSDALHTTYHPDANLVTDFSTPLHACIVYCIIQFLPTYPPKTKILDEFVSPMFWYSQERENPGIGKPQNYIFSYTGLSLVVLNSGPRFIVYSCS
eukprot:882444-Amphidinium_carterae.1